jgi:uncharacterized RDD family membrane protein YckC
MSAPAPAPTTSRRQPPELFDRFAAKAIDAAIWLLLALVVPPAGTLFGVLFWLFSDGLVGGASPGKHLVGLMVLHKDERRPITLKESTLRNVPFAVPALLLLLPAGPIFCAVVGIPVLLLETYFLVSDPEEVRIGDIFGDSRVVTVKPRRRKRGSRARAPFEEDPR